VFLSAFALGLRSPRVVRAGCDVGTRAGEDIEACLTMSDEGRALCEGEGVLIGVGDAAPLELALLM